MSEVTEDQTHNSSFTADRRNYQILLCHGTVFSNSSAEAYFTFVFDIQGSHLLYAHIETINYLNKRYRGISAV